MRLHRLLADGEAAGDLGVGQALGDQPEHLGLAGREGAERRQPVGGRRPAAGELGDQAAGDGGGDQRVARGDDPDGVEQPLGGDVLEQEPAGPGVQCVVHVLVEVERRQHQDAGPAVGRRRHDAPRGLDAVEVGHAHVHDHDVGVVLGAQPHRRQTVGREADDPEVGLRPEDRAERRAHDVLVVGDHDADQGVAHGAGAPGRTAATANPPAASGPAVIVPPSIAVRSRMPSSPCPPASEAAGRPRPLSRTRTCSASGR